MLAHIQDWAVSLSSVCGYQQNTEVGWAPVETKLIFNCSKLLVKHPKIVLKTQMGLFRDRSEWFPGGYGGNSAKDILCGFTK